MLPTWRNYILSFTVVSLFATEGFTQTQNQHDWTVERFIPMCSDQNPLGTKRLLCEGYINGVTALAAQADISLRTKLICLPKEKISEDEMRLRILRRLRQMKDKTFASASAVRQALIIEFPCQK